MRPWKLVTFVAAAASLILIAPYANDPTWDYFVTGMMALLTFATAPWAVGKLYRWLRYKETTWPHGSVAVLLWLVSVGWSYDLYWFLRDGEYPITWVANLIASSLLYLGAGLLWNLDVRPARGLTFAFMEPEWLTSAPAPFSKIAWPALALIAAVSAFVAAWVEPLANVWPGCCRALGQYFPC